MKNLKMHNAGCPNLLHNQGMKHALMITTCRGLGFSMAILLLMLIMAGCKKDKADRQVEPVITNKVNVELPTDPGEVGLVIDTREIFRKGFIATTAEVSFSELPGFSKTLDIDPVLNIAIFRIPNDSLTKEQKDAFAKGITTDIIIKGEGQDLAHYTNKQILDDSGKPLPLGTDKSKKIPAVMLKENIAYYVQPQEVGGDGDFPKGGVLKSFSPVLYDFQLPEPNVFHYKYYVKPVGGSANTYYILRAANDPPKFTPTFYFYLNASNVVDVTEDQNKALAFVFEQDAKGWALVRQLGTNKYLAIGEGTSSTSSDWKALSLTPGTGNRFRFISADITWSGEDRGTVYQQPIMPASKIEFAYQSTIKNCSAGTLTETIGVTKSRTSTRTLETTESLQLLSSVESDLGLKVGAEAGASVPAVGEVKASVEFSRNLKITTTATVSSENKISDVNQQTSEVSRTRTLEVLPRTGVEVYDAVRVVKNARIPFTQVLRLKATYNYDGTKLTGAEIITQMQFNFAQEVHDFAQAVPTKIGADYVEVSIRGEVLINEMFETETGAKDLPNACN